MATTTKTTEAPASTPTEGLTTGLSADNYKTEQVKSGRDPVSPAVEPVAAVPLDVAPNEPYPEGSPNPPPVERVPHNADKPEWYEPVPPVTGG